LPLCDKLGSLAVVNACRCHQAQAGMVVLVVVPGKEVLAEAARILNQRSSRKSAFRGLKFEVAIGFVPATCSNLRSSSLEFRDADACPDIRSTPSAI